MTHTPTPWSVSGMRIKFGGVPVLSIFGPDDTTHVLVLYGDGSTEQHRAAHADANLIVTAVNSHDGLLEALEGTTKLARALIRAIEEHTDGKLLESHERSITLFHADEAIKAAR